VDVKGAPLHLNGGELFYLKRCLSNFISDKINFINDKKDFISERRQPMLSARGKMETP
jgi:hypothetical protein